MIENGATTTWEHWDGLRSRIHNCYNGHRFMVLSSLGWYSFCWRTLLLTGKFLIQPQTTKEVTWAKTSKETPYGTIVVNWEVKAKTMAMSLEIPVGINAEVVIPSGIKKIQD